MIVNDTFESVRFSDSYFVGAGNFITFMVRGGGSGTVILESSRSGGLSWKERHTLDGSDKTLSFEENIGQLYRIRCASYVSGTIRAQIVSDNGEKKESQNDNKIAIIGTSLIQHNSIATASRVSNWSRGVLAWAATLYRDINYEVWHDVDDVNGRFFSGANHGVSGETSTQIISRLAAVKAMRPNYCIVDNGTNEMATRSYEEITSDTKTIYDELLSVGITVIALPVLAREISSWASGSETRKKAQKVNAWRRNYARKTNGVLFFDWNQGHVDPDNTDGEPYTGYSIDGIHYNPEGAFASGSRLKDFLASIVQAQQPAIVGQDDDYDASFNELGNLFPNPMMVGTAGTNGTGSTGSVADSCRVERSSGTTVTVANTKETRGDSGSYQVLTFTPGGAAEETFLLRTSTANLGHTYATGDWVVAECDVDVSAYDGWKTIQLSLDDQGTDGINGFSLEDFDSTGLQDFPKIAWAGRFRTPAFQIVSGSTDFRVRVETTIDGAIAGTPVLKVGSWRVSKIEDPRTAWGYV